MDKDGACIAARTTDVLLDGGFSGDPTASGTLLPPATATGDAAGSVLCVMVTASRSRNERLADSDRGDGILSVDPANTGIGRTDGPTIANVCACACDPETGVDERGVDEVEVEVEVEEEDKNGVTSGEGKGREEKEEDEH